MDPPPSGRRGRDQLRAAAVTNPFRRRPRRPPPASPQRLNQIHRSPTRSADADGGVSWRMLLAAAMLHRGDDVTSVAAETGVPVALLDLMGREMQPGITPVVLPPAETLRRRRFNLTVSLIGTAAVADTATAIAALAHHLTAVGLFSGAAAVTLTAALRLLARSTHPGHPPGR